MRLGAFPRLLARPGFGKSQNELGRDFPLRSGRCSDPPCPPMPSMFHFRSMGSSSRCPACWPSSALSDLPSAAAKAGSRRVLIDARSPVPRTAWAGGLPLGAEKRAVRGSRGRGPPDPDRRGSTGRPGEGQSREESPSTSSLSPSLSRMAMPLRPLSAISLARRSWVNVRLTVSVVRPRKSAISVRLMGISGGEAGRRRFTARRESETRKEATRSLAVFRPRRSI